MHTALFNLYVNGQKQAATVVPRTNIATSMFYSLHLIHGFVQELNVSSLLSKIPNILCQFCEPILYNNAQGETQNVEVIANQITFYTTVILVTLTLIDNCSLLHFAIRALFFAQFNE